jgi:uncharacterized protein involved in exopolysaccharide biosynthesis
MNEDTMKFGLLLESAQAHQRSVEQNLESLKAHTRDLDAVVRDEIRRTLIDEMQALSAETNRALGALRAMGRAASLRASLWSFACAGLAALIPGALLWWSVPTPAELSALRERRDALAASIAQLELQGGRAVWRHCGEPQRLCVRIDRSAPAYGEAGDFLIVKGY